MEGCHGSRDLEGRRGRREQHVLLMQHQQQQLFGAAARVPSFGDGPGESEAGGSESEPARPRGSGSKRSRAAEVHNMSEKRRRSRINEKMKALQSLIPNSNKTDKASMLDEAIEYLKQLQLQVQMLSMRNGVYFHPSYFSGAFEPTQASQMFAALGGSNVTGSNSGVVMPPINQSSGAHHSFEPLNSPQNHPPLVLSSVPNASVREPPFRVESSQPHFQSFQLPESSVAIFHEEIMPKHHLISAQERTSLPESNMKSIRQESPVVNADHFDGCSLSKEQQSQEMVPKNTGPA